VLESTEPPNVAITAEAAVDPRSLAPWIITGQSGAMSSPTRGWDRSGGFRIEVMPAPRYQTVIDSFMVPVSWLVAWSVLEPPPRRNRDTFRVVIRNPRGEWRALRITSRDEAERVRDETQSRIESVGIDAWSREIRGRIPESFFR
jgi:hypothetical protein